MTARVWLAFVLAVIVGMLAACSNPVDVPSAPEPAASQTTLTPSAEQAAVGEEPVTITAQVRDADGNPIAAADVPITFVASAGVLESPSGSRATQITVVSDEQGIATVTFVPDADGTVTVTAYWGSEASTEPIGEITIAVSTVAMADLTVVYDGAEHALQPDFLPVEAGNGAKVEYERTSDGTVSTDPPSAAGVYAVTATAADGYEGTAEATLTILPRTLSVLPGFAFADKAYDGGSSATASVELDRTNAVEGDDVMLDPATRGEFQVLEDYEWTPSAIVGSYGFDGVTRVIGTLDLTGEHAGNYVVDQPVGAANITPRAVSIADATASGRIYDGTTNVAIEGTLAPEPYADDDVAFVAAFASADAGESIPVTVTLTGADAANYTLSNPELTADISPRPIDIVPDARSKTYGATLDLGSEAFTVTNLVDGESLDGVTLASPGAAADADAGSYEVVASAAVAGTGTNLANYDVSYGVSTLAVEPGVLTVDPDPEQRKTYGDPDPAEWSYGTEGLVDGDTLTGVTLTRAPGEDVGTYAFELSQISIDDGAAGANYEVVLGADANFSIVARPLDVSPDEGQAKIYGDADPELTFATSGLVGDDTIDGALGRETGENVGTYAYTLGDLTVLDGNGGSNYDVRLGDAPRFTIEPRTVTVAGSFSVADRPYDGTANATIASDELQLVDVVEGDAVELLPVAAFADRHVGADKPVSLTDASTLSGATVDAGNYVLDLTGAPTATASIVQAPISFQIANKDSLTYDGSTALPLVVVTEPTATPSNEPVAYSLQYRLVEDNTGATVDRGVSAIRDAGAYRVTVTSTDPRYDGQDEIVVTVAHRPIALATDTAGKTYGDPDPDLTPTVTDGTLGADDVATGQLGYGPATDAGTYELGLGTFAIERGGADVTANYLVSVEGAFTIEPAPVTFDIANADFVQDGVHVFVRDGSTQVGLDIASDPAGVVDFVLTYRRTHDANHDPVPTAEQPVSAIGELGTYQVTIESTGSNYTGTSIRTVWLTDATGAGVADGVAETFALVGGRDQVVLALVGSDGSTRSAGPVPVTLELDAPDGVAFLDPVAGHVVSSVTIAAGQSSATVDVQPLQLADAPFPLSATPTSPFQAAPTPASWTLQAEADLVFAGGPFATGAGAASEPIRVELHGADGAPVAAPAPIALSLSGDVGIVFRNQADDADLTEIEVATGASHATFRATSDTAGDYSMRASNASAFVGIHATPDTPLTVTPRPRADAVEPATLEKAQTATVVATGSGFADGMQASFSGSDVTVEALTVDSATQATLTIRIDTSSDAGTRDLTLLNADGGTSTMADAVSLTLPTLTATDDASIALVEGGSVDVTIADLLANDGSSSQTVDWRFDGVVATQNVDVAEGADTLSVSSTGAFGDAAWLDYQIVDDFGTTDVARVPFAISLPPLDAILFTDAQEFEDFKSAEYSVPTFQEVFDTWPRVSGGTYYSDPKAATGDAAAWEYLTDDVDNDGTSDPRVSQPMNVSPSEGLVSPESDAQDYFTFEATLFSNDADNDSIGLIAAFTTDGGTPKYLVAHRTHSGNSPSSGWGLSYYSGSSYQVLVEPTVGSFTTSTGWNSDASRVKVERTGDIIRIWATDWNDTANYAPDSEIVVDLANGTVSANGNTISVSEDLSVFRGRQQYGYYTYSQPNSTYLDIAFEGGVARDVAILLTGGTDTDATAGDDTWSGSEVWRFANATWTLGSATIQTELNYPRTVTSVAEPGTGSSYASYSDYGRSFRIFATEVILETQ